MPKQIYVSTQSRSVQITLHANFFFHQLSGGSCWPGQRERWNYDSCDEIVSGPRQNINSLKDSPKYSQTGQFITEELNSISILCNEWERCFYISSYKFYYSCRLQWNFVSPGFLNCHNCCHFSSPTILDVIFHAIFLAISLFLVPFLMQFIFSSLSHRCLTRKARPTRQAINLTKSFFLVLDLLKLYNLYHLVVTLWQ